MVCSRNDRNIQALTDSGLLLHANIETAMDECRVVIYPEEQGGKIEWKLYVTDAKMLPQLVTDIIHWKVSKMFCKAERR